MFLALAAAGQVILVVLARLVLVPTAEYLCTCYGLSRRGSAEIGITAPLALQIGWICLIVVWLMD